MSCKERRIQQHKSKRGHRESSWGGPSRAAALAFSLRSCFFDFGAMLSSYVLLHIATWACESCTQSTQRMRRSDVQSHLPGVRSRGTVVLHFTPPSPKRTSSNCLRTIFGQVARFGTSWGLKGCGQNSPAHLFLARSLFFCYHCTLLLLYNVPSAAALAQRAACGCGLWLARPGQSKTRVLNTEGRWMYY